MALATLTARVDGKDKASFDTFCSNVGQTASSTTWKRGGSTLPTVETTIAINNPT